MFHSRINARMRYEKIAYIPCEQQILYIQNDNTVNLLFIPRPGCAPNNKLLSYRIFSNSFSLKWRKIALANSPPPPRFPPPYLSRSVAHTRTNSQHKYNVLKHAICVWVFSSGKSQLRPPPNEYKTKKTSLQAFERSIGRQYVSVFLT